MKLVRATLKNTQTADGINSMMDGVKPGTFFYVDLDQVQDLVWGEVGNPAEVVRRSIFCDSAENGTGAGWLPVEVLDIPGMNTDEPLWTFREYMGALDLLQRAHHRIAEQFSMGMARQVAQDNLHARSLLLKHRDATCTEAESIYANPKKVQA